MADTSLRRTLSVTAAAGLLLIPACQATEEPAAPAEAIRTPLDAFEGVAVESTTVEAGHSTVGTSYPRVAASHPLMMEVRTRMAERQTEFLEGLPDQGGSELQQDATFLAVSSQVVGARITAAVSSGVQDEDENQTLWYDASSDEVLPWTSLFADEAALERAHLSAAAALQEEYGMTAQQLPGVLGEVASRADEAQETEEAAADGENQEAAAPEDSLDLSDPEQAAEAAEDWAGSPLEDLAFSTAGGMAVDMAPGEVPEASGGQAVVLPVKAEATEGVLSELGLAARDAALNNESGPGEFPLDGSTDEQGVSMDCARLKCVALTFDDGPGEHTDRLMDILDEYDARATFYVLGQLVAEHPEALERMADEGHELGNHTWKHDDLAELSAEEVRQDIARTNDAISEITGSDPPTIRPPYGSVNDTVSGAVDQPIILWDVDTQDWQSRDSHKVADHALTHTDTGSVVLFHDIHGKSVDAVPDVLDGLHEEGYHFVTITDLFGLGGMGSGDVLTDARMG
ncbi:polysaccharide deacetylase family protein [Nocardiopsis sp. HNM0947]|uniref:Polysaccharide deacetylase family protein n=1 Tax=Nocardiopsis coralli TaxID=2772213 RepID=A0ABR9PCP5_9ACTN|nr:polysaccharide deacetylase family protein [Nocardiopsis coralli]MBE3001592.1 polysaccharide deacetylase family protein [Nocardiopsis coralli]